MRWNSFKKHIVGVVVLLAAVLAPIGWIRGEDEGKDEQEIRQVVQRFITAWHRQDTKEQMAQLYDYPDLAADCPTKPEDLPMLLLIDGDGRVGQVIPFSRKMLEAMVREQKQPPKGETPKIEVKEVEVMKKAALVKACWESKHSPTRLALLLAKSEKGWRVGAVAGCEADDEE